MPVTTKRVIMEWVRAGIDQGATHLIVVCDCFDYDDYPVYVTASEDLRKESLKYGNPDSEGRPVFENSKMQKVMEIYDLSRGYKAIEADPRSRVFDL